MKAHNVCFFILLLISCAFANNAQQRSKRRVHLPFLGIGPYCNGCPAHFCDDDPAIIHGFCCGCAGYFDNLPVSCSTFLKCPLNGQQLCRDYEYMMHCCCEK